ncbi:hypothetical protein Aduo_019748 [Ancylostoma duodenale]
MWAGPGRGAEVTTGPPIIIAAFEMSSRHTYAVLFIASILVLQYVTAQSRIPPLRTCPPYSVRYVQPRKRTHPGTKPLIHSITSAGGPIIPPALKYSNRVNARLDVNRIFKAMMNALNDTSIPRHLLRTDILDTLGLFSREKPSTKNKSLTMDDDDPNSVQLPYHGRKSDE